MDFVSDANWRAVTPRAADAAPDPAERTSPAVALGGIELSPWRLGEHFLDVARANRDWLPVERAALVAADPLMTALGRPNREQVVTVRQSTATTLQVLELTNGGTLAALLKEGADRRFVQSPLHPLGLIDVLYRQAVGRPPTPREATLAAAIVGSPARREGIEDFLWALTMLPEFQMIH